ncbi:MAG: protein translocase subunit SecD [Acidobacteria bacterium]|nr:protein translocase subunit SecD [Acidobacteriota bacterium]
MLIRTIIIVAVTLIGVYLVFGPRGSVEASDFSWDGIKNNLSENINLGLDLKGGSHLVMRVKTDDYLKTITENNREAALTAAKEAQLPVGDASSVAENNNYQVTLNATDASKTQEIIEAVKKKVDFSGWTENVSGNAISWSLPVAVQKVLKDQAVTQAERIIESRINAFGVKEPTFARHGATDSGQLLLQMPGVDDPERVKKLINSDSRLELMKVDESSQGFPTEEAALQSFGGTVPPNRKVFPVNERDDSAQNNNDPNKQPSRWLVLESPAIIDGSEMRDASAFSETGGDSNYKITFSLKPAGAQKFGEWTGKNIGKSMAVVLNDEVKSVASIRGQIFDSGEITGRFSKGTAEDLALTLKSGALPAKIEYQEERTVGPSLGADSIRAGVTASIGGLIFVIIFMLIYYRGAGINAVIALVLNLLLTVAGLIVLDSTLTLPGIAGLILGIGMAVDSNVLIFERMREELRAGKSVAKAVEQGFDRAFITIIDTHITTILSSVILYMYGSGPIRGFAVTLILGLLINLFSAVFVSRTIFMWLLERNPNMKKLSI